MTFFILFTGVPDSIPVRSFEHEGPQGLRPRLVARVSHRRARRGQAQGSSAPLPAVRPALACRFCRSGHRGPSGSIPRCACARRAGPAFWPAARLAAACAQAAHARCGDRVRRASRGRRRFCSLVALSRLGSVRCWEAGVLSCAPSTHLFARASLVKRSGTVYSRGPILDTPHADVR